MEEEWKGKDEGKRKEGVRVRLRMRVIEGVCESE